MEIVARISALPLLKRGNYIHVLVHYLHVAVQLRQVVSREEDCLEVGHFWFVVKSRPHAYGIRSQNLMSEVSSDLPDMSTCKRRVRPS